VMEWLTILYLFYTFIAFYFLLLYILTYLQNYKEIYEIVKPEKNYSLSIVVPCYNEADSIGKNIEALLASDYPGLKKIIVVDDCSTDNSYKVIKSFAEKYSRVMAVQTPKNTGRAAGAKNYGAKFVKTELIGFSDADSFPRKDAVSNMVGFFNNPKTGAVTSRVLIENRKNILTKIQSIEYKIIAFTRKLLGFLDSIYVTNGPLSIYRKKAFDEVGGFDMKNLTEDIEITWHFVAKGWGVQMAVPANVYTVCPEKIKPWFRQRIRWNVGGIQTVSKYKKNLLSCGMLGLFILPFFVLSWFLGLAGLFLLGYRTVNYVVTRYLITRYSLAANVAVLRFEELTLNPSILFLFGLLLFSLGFIFTLMGIAYSREKQYERTRIRDIFIYSIFYLLMYPPLLVVSFYKYIRREEKW
jgi:cellulose synthase/poly-beta-1,6-N-acetylglucosamine synthase-like glycosyltransferase